LLHFTHSPSGTERFRCSVLIREGISLSNQLMGTTLTARAANDNEKAARTQCPGAHELLRPPYAATSTQIATRRSLPQAAAPTASC
jgi:hypothetical protein